MLDGRTPVGPLICGRIVKALNEAQEQSDLDNPEDATYTVVMVEVISYLGMLQEGLFAPEEHEVILHQLRAVRGHPMWQVLLRKDEKYFREAEEMYQGLIAE